MDEIEFAPKCVSPGNQDCQYLTLKWDEIKINTAFFIVTCFGNVFLLQTISKYITLTGNDVKAPKMFTSAGSDVKMPKLNMY